MNNLEERFAGYVLAMQEIRALQQGAGPCQQALRLYVLP